MDSGHADLGMLSDHCDVSRHSVDESVLILSSRCPLSGSQEWIAVTNQTCLEFASKCSDGKEYVAVHCTCCRRILAYGCWVRLLFAANHYLRLMSF